MRTSSKALRLLGLAIAFGAWAPEAGLAQNNANGFIHSDAWNLLGPLRNPFGAAPPGVALDANWLAPSMIGDPAFNPRGVAFQAHADGGEFPAIDFAGESPSPGSGYGDLAPSPVWYTLPALEAAFPFAVPFPRDEGGERVNFQQLADHINESVVPEIPGASEWPGDGVMYVATTYIENTGDPNVLGVCTASDDSIQVWVNNKRVLSKSIARGAGGRGTCQEVTDAFIPAGVSKISVLVWEGEGGHNFRLGLVGNDGRRLRDGNPAGIVFHGAGAPKDGLSGQEQYCVDRDVVGDRFACYDGKEGVTVTITGSGPGDGGDRLTVMEDVGPGDVEVTDVSGGGTVDDLLRRCDRVTVPELLTSVFVGTDEGGESFASFDAATGVYTSKSTSGGDIWADGDSFMFNYDVVTGDFDISIQVVERRHETGAGRWGKFGLMARQTLDSDSRYTMIQDHLPDLQDPARVAGRRRHNVADGDMFEELGPIPHPEFLRLTRRGSVVTGWVSDNAGLRDGSVDPCRDSNWERVHSEDWLRNAPDELFVGFANSEHNSEGPVAQTIRYRLLEPGGDGTEVFGQRVTWEVTRRELNDGLSYRLEKPRGGGTGHVGEHTEGFIGGIPSVPFVTGISGPVGDFGNSHDIGRPPTVGSTTEGGGVYTVSGSGADIWNSGDHMRFAYEMVEGDFQATVRVADLTIREPDGGANPAGNTRWGRYGIMARYTCDLNSKYSLSSFNYRGEDPNLGGGHETPGQDSPRHQSRRDHLVNGTTRDEQELHRQGYRALGADLGAQLGWARLTRCSDYFFTEFAPDEGGRPGEWFFTGGDTHIDPPDTVLVGLVASSHSTAGDNQLAVTYDNWTVEESVWPDRNAEAGEVFARLTFDGDGPVADSRLEAVADGFFPERVDGRLRLTEDGTNDTAAAVYLDTTGEGLGDTGLVAEYDVFYHGEANAGDGMTFAVYESDVFPTAGALLGGRGGNLGYELGSDDQIPPTRVKSFAVELDTWDGGHGGNDPPQGGSNTGGVNAYHMGMDFHQNTQSAQNNVERGVELPAVFGGSGAPAHGLHVRVSYDPSPVDDRPSLSQITVHAQRIDAETGEAAGNEVMALQAYGPRLFDDVIVGFTAATGGATASYEIDDFVIARAELDPAGFKVRPADYNVDGTFDLSDAVGLLGFLFLGGDPPPCGASFDPTEPSGQSNLMILDSNSDGKVDVSDAVSNLNFLFLGGPRPDPIVVAGQDGCLTVPDCPENCP